MLSFISLFLLFIVSAKTESCSIGVSLNLRTSWNTAGVDFFLYDVIVINNGDLDVTSDSWYFTVVAESEVDIYQSWNLFHLGAGDATREHAVFGPNAFWPTPFSRSSEYRSAGFISTQRVTLDTVVGVECSQDSSSSSSSSDSDSGIFCTEEVHSCPDGSTVGRDPSNNCEFLPCPPVICSDLAKLCPDGSSVHPDPNNNCKIPACPGDNTNGTVCTEEVKLCSDGTQVGRDSNNNCEYFPCPGDNTNGTFCTEEVHSCPDGSTVGRDPSNNCEFLPCPIVICSDLAKLCPDGSSVHPDPNNNCKIPACPGQVCTEEVRVCPGSGIEVGRDSSNNCEFFPCPTRCDVEVSLLPRTSDGSIWTDNSGNMNQVYDISVKNTGVCRIKSVTLNFSLGAGTFISSKWNINDQYKLMNFGDLLAGNSFLNAGIIVTGNNGITVQLGSKACDCTN